MTIARRALLAGLLASLTLCLPEDADARGRRRRRRRGAGAIGSGGGQRGTTDGECPCNGGKVCVGPRGGRYCITSSGNKRYGV